MAQPPREFTVTDVRDIPAQTPDRMGKWDKIIQYTLADGQRYNVLVPAEDFEEQVLIAAVKRHIEERGQWLNRKFNL